MRKTILLLLGGVVAPTILSAGVSWPRPGNGNPDLANQGDVPPPTIPIQNPLPPPCTTNSFVNPMTGASFEAYIDVNTMGNGSLQITIYQSGTVGDASLTNLSTGRTRSASYFSNYYVSLPLVGNGEYEICIVTSQGTYYAYVMINCLAGPAVSDSTIAGEANSDGGNPFSPFGHFNP